MAIDNKQFWFDRLKSFIPSAVYSDDDETLAILWGMAAVLDRIDCALGSHVAETFICQASGGYLNEHGDERNVLRSNKELDPSYAQRIKNITNSAACPDLKSLVDALLDVGESKIIEDDIASVFFNRETFYNRGDILVTPITNTFSIIVDKQVHEPYSFYSREYFTDREDFIGTNESSLELFELIVQAVNQSKACATAYRLIEKLG